VINFNLLPEGAFEPMASVANNLIDKLYTATGYIFTPKGKKKDMEDAVSFFVNEIKSNKEMPILAKAAAISDARKLIKEYCNQQDILNIAMDNLEEAAKPDLIDNDWLGEFWAKAGCINDNEIKILFGKILAGACNGKGTRVSKSLIHKICVMDSMSAKAIQKLSEFVVKIYAIDMDGNVIDKEINALYFGDHFGWDDKYNCNDLQLLELEALGILKYELYTIAFGGTINNVLKPIKELRIYCNNQFFTITGDNKDFKDLSIPVRIPAGMVCLTNDGKYLMSLFENIKYSDEYFERIKSVFREDGYKVW
jgi:Protein of unknown function (DUF2806).